MKIIKYNFIKENFFESQENSDSVIVKKILKEIELKGDSAVKFYSKKFDGQNGNFEVTKKEIKEAYKQVDKKIIIALKKAATNIRKFAKLQMKQFRSFKVKINGNILGQKVIAISKVGCYVPGGNYPLPSSALMSVIPARVAGVSNIFVFSPRIKPVTLVAADIAKADRIFRIGGVQAIGAMTYGTKTIPKVDKIVGPGNKYVILAKKEVYGLVGIDFIAGPSEVTIISDKTGNPKFIASDLLAQAEHDVDAKPNLITTSKKLAIEVNRQLKIQLKDLKTGKIAKQALLNGKIILVNNLNKAIEIANKKSPEHLELQIKNPARIINKLRNYGSLFIGKNSAEVFGDYCSGTNHTLPTNGSARFTSGLCVKDFLKFNTYQRIKNPNKLIKIARQLAFVEGLEAHKKAAEIRMETNKNPKNFTKSEKRNKYD